MTTFPDWLQPWLTPANLALAGMVLFPCAILFGALILWTTSRRHTSRALLLEDEIRGLRDFLEDQRRAAFQTAESNSGRIEELKKTLQEQSRILESVRVSSTVSEHWDVLEKIVLFSEQLEKLNREITRSFASVMDDIKAQHQERVRHSQSQFKTQVEQARKTLEKTVTGKLAALPHSKELEHLGASLIDSIRYSMLTIGKLHHENLTGFSRALLDDVEIKVQDGVRNTFCQVEDLRQKIEEAPQLLGTDWNPLPASLAENNGVTAIPESTADSQETLELFAMPHPDQSHIVELPAPSSNDGEPPESVKFPQG